MKHIVALSGGKDSSAMALALAEREPRDYSYFFTPTGDEPDELFDHIRALGERLGKPIEPVMRSSLARLVREMGALPNWRQRWCTRILKIETAAKWLADQGECVLYVGLRADEAEREGGDYITTPNVTVDHPMRRWGWTIEDVRTFLDERGVVIPKRTDCLKCFYQRLIEWYELWRDHNEIFLEAELWEDHTGYTFRSPGRDTRPTPLWRLRQEFERGAIPKDTRKPFGDACRVCRL